MVMEIVQHEYWQSLNQMKNKHLYILYRGPLERSRVAFILDSVFQLYEHVSFIWVFPGNNLHTKQEGFRNMVKAYPGLSVVVINDRAIKLPLTLLKILKLIDKKSEYDLVLIGITAPFFSWMLNPEKQFWFINGIPEERESYSQSLKLKLLTKIEWLLLKQLPRPDLIITVSSRMSAHLKNIFSKCNFVAIPTTVDLPTYQKNKSGPHSGYFTYLGSGAPWQALDLLSTVWQEIYLLDPSVKFRVISRDHKTKVLALGLPQANIEFVATENFEQVAHYLSESEVGFLIRKESLVNRVCFPTKMAEYLAGGCWVVTSDIDWDIADYMKRFQVGLLVDPDNTPELIAKQVLIKRDELRHDKELNQRMLECVNELSRAKWITELQANVNGYLS